MGLFYIGLAGLVGIGSDGAGGEIVPTFCAANPHRTLRHDRQHTQPRNCFPASAKTALDLRSIHSHRAAEAIGWSSLIL